MFYHSINEHESLYNRRERLREWEKLAAPAYSFHGGPPTFVFGGLRKKLLIFIFLLNIILRSSRKSHVSLDGLIYCLSSNLMMCLMFPTRTGPAWELQHKPFHSERRPTVGPRYAGWWCRSRLKVYSFMLQLTNIQTFKK